MTRTKKSRKKKQLKVIGWREWLSIPTLGVDRIKAKVDTGARSSAIHAFNVRTFSEHGAPHVSFQLHPVQDRRHPSIEAVAEIRDERMVKSSNGQRELRFVIDVDINMGGLVWPVELTLTDRDPMGFRMLLGREAIRKRFLVDAGRSFLAERN